MRARCCPPRAGTTFCLSQRAEHIWEGVSSATTRSRPIINTRDEPHADAERYRRLHVIVGDSNMSQTTTLLKVGSADLVLRMLESGVSIRDHTLENPIRAIREISHDLTGTRAVRLANGRMLSAWQIQADYLERVELFAQGSGLAQVPIYARVLDLWRRTLTAVSTDDLGAVDTEIDWVIKHRLLQRYIDRHDLSWSSPRIAQLDLAYHDISRTRGLFNLLETKGMAATVCAGHRGVRRQVDPAADHACPPAWGVHHRRHRSPAGLHRRLGAPQAQRPGPAHGAVQGPVQVRRRAGAATHRLDVTRDSAQAGTATRVRRVNRRTTAPVRTLTLVVAGLALLAGCWTGSDGGTAATPAGVGSGRDRPRGGSACARLPRRLPERHDVSSARA